MKDVGIVIFMISVIFFMISDAFFDNKVRNRIETLEKQIQILNERIENGN